MIFPSSITNYSPLNAASSAALSVAPGAALKAKPMSHGSSSKRLPFHRIWTRNVVFTLITVAFFEFHLGYASLKSVVFCWRHSITIFNRAFTNLWAVFLTTPRPSTEELAAHPPSLPFSFTGGLGMPASTAGFATSILGLLGMMLQLTLYPSVNARLGTLRSLQYFLPLFPIAYLLAPYLAVLPSSTIPPAAAAGIFIWIGIIWVLLLQVTARTFTLPATIILLNNCSPHPSVLGTVHGIGQSVSAACRTIGPLVSGWWYGAGLESGVVGAAWWAVSGVAIAGCVTAIWVYEGSGHEIVLEGEGQNDEDVEMEGLLSGESDRESESGDAEEGRRGRP